MSRKDELLRGLKEELDTLYGGAHPSFPAPPPLPAPARPRFRTTARGVLIALSLLAAPLTYALSMRWPWLLQFHTVPLGILLLCGIEALEREIRRGA